MRIREDELRRDLDIARLAFIVLLLEGAISVIAFTLGWLWVGGGQ